VLCIRDPREVAASLNVRNGMHPERAAVLWLHYTVAGFCNDPERLVLDYADVLEDAETAARRLQSHLQLPNPMTGALTEVIADVDVTMHHHREHGPPAGHYMALAVSLHQLLRSLDASLLLPLLSTLLAELNRRPARSLSAQASPQEPVTAEESPPVKDLQQRIATLNQRLAVEQRLRASAEGQQERLRQRLDAIQDSLIRAGRSQGAFGDRPRPSGSVPHPEDGVQD
jgi:hypothetical protein